MKKETIIKLTHIVGSIASITAVSILFIERSTNSLSTKEIVFYVITAIMVLGVASFFTGLAKAAFDIIISKTKDSVNRRIMLIGLLIFIVGFVSLFLFFLIQWWYYESSG